MVASESAKFGQPEINLGVSPGAGGTTRLARLVGPGKALEWVLRGRTFYPEEAKEEGLVHHVVQKKDVAEKTYKNAKDSGKKASLISSSRTNIFKTKIANIEPGELIIVEIRYQDKLKLKNNEYSIRIPTVITHRYENDTRINIKKSNSEINLKDMLQDLRNESEIEKLNPDLHSPINENNDYTINPYAINIDLNVGFNISTPSSNEKININKISDTHYFINLVDGTMPSTKDFVIKFKPIVSPEPYVEIYGENVGDDFYLYGLVNPQIKHTDLT